MNQHISIIIPVFNALAHTQNCLKQLKHELSSHPTGKHFTIIVTDDGSTDGTGEWIRNNHPEVILLKGDGNLWWSGGINMGTEYALKELNADYVLWWNNDTTAGEGYFRKLLEIVDGDAPKIGGSKIYYANTSKIWSMGGIFDTTSGRKYMMGMNEPDMAVYNEITPADWLPGMGTFIHKDVFKTIGTVDDVNFPQYHGDSDFTYRATLAGYKILVYPQLQIWNDKSNSGLMHNNSFRQLIRTLNDTKSNYHIGKDITFYRRYASSMRAYKTLAYKYCYYLGGFLKWKILNTVGLSKKESV